jgi:hypothetical protein
MVQTNRRGTRTRMNGQQNNKNENENENENNDYKTSGGLPA